jgi:transcription initiation factor IIF auxiliary subunit
MDSLRSEFQAERERMGFETEAERERFNKEISQASNNLSELQAEKSRLGSEVEAVKEHSVAELKRVRAEAEAAVAAAISSAIPQSSNGEEIAKVEAKLAAVVQLVEDPATELSVVIRKNVEKLELEAYLKGLRYADGKPH